MQSSIVRTIAKGPSQNRRIFLPVSARTNAPRVAPPVLFTAVMVISSVIAPCRVVAGEPAELFLQRLRSAEYFDVALGYLDALESYPGVSGELLQAKHLERAQVYFEAAGATRIPAEQEKYFSAGEQDLRQFIDENPSHPRVSEARIILGTRQLIHAMVLSRNPKQDDEIKEKTRKEYLAAAQTFDKIIDTLKEELAAMPTGPINESENPGLTERREQYRGEYMQAQLQAAHSRRLAAETYSKPAEQGKELLEEALKRLLDFSEKYRGYPPGTRAMLYAGQIQQLLGDQKAALDSYQRVQEQVDDDRLRSLKIEAAIGTVELRLAEDPPAYQLAIDRGQPWVDGARPNEKRTNEVQRLRLELAKAYLEKVAKSEKPKDKNDATKAARQLLNDARKIPGAHVEETRSLLATLGVEPEEQSVEVERPGSLNEALTAAKTLIESSDQLALSQQVLNRQINEPGADKEDIETQLDEVEKEITQQREKASTLLQMGLAMLAPDDDTTLVNQARNLFAFNLFRQNLFHEAAVVGEFLAQAAPGDPLGLSGGMIALNAYQTLARDAEDSHRDEVMRGLSEIGNYLVRHWPDDPGVAGARGALIAVALNQQRWDEARKHLEATPDDSPDKANFLRIMGTLTWNSYLLKLQENPEDPEAAELLPVAAKDLRAGLKPLQPDQVSQRELDTSLILTKVLIRQDKQEEAMRVLENPSFGALTLADKGSQDFQFSALTTALQVFIGQMTSADANADELTGKANEIVNRMQKVAGDNPQSKARMIDNFKLLARDIRQQMDSAPPAKRKTLVTAFQTLMTGLADAAQDDRSTLMMVGQTFAQIGEGAMTKPEPPATGQAFDLLQSGREMLMNVLANEQDPEERVKLHFQLGRMARLQGDFANAIKEFAEVVRIKQTMLTAQEEAALTYQQWGIASADTPARAARAHEMAILGSRPDDKGKNQIWGWNTISKRTGNNPNFRDAFFNARYHLALNRYLQGKALRDEKKMRDAITFTSDLLRFFPDLGSPEWRTKFDRLLRDVQGSLGEPVNGLEALQTVTSSSS